MTDGVTEKAKQGRLLDSGLSTKVDEISKSVHCYAEVWWRRIPRNFKSADAMLPRKASKDII